MRMHSCYKESSYTLYVFEYSERNKENIGVFFTLTCEIIMIGIHEVMENKYFFLGFSLTDGKKKKTIASSYV